MAEAEEARRRLGRRTILFVDEIHRFNKAQQDAFLPRVEAGDLVLVGATTENPSFEVIAALLSRSKVYVLQPLDEAAIGEILQAGVDRRRTRAGPSGGRPHRRWPGGARALCERRCPRRAERAGAGRRGSQGGDRSGASTRALVADLLEKRALLYDKAGEEHYNVISALHKSLRNSDPDAAVYWLARMLEAGEDPMYVARRLVRFASEDVGLADPQALPLAVAAAQATHQTGMPEASTALAEAALYLATAPKSNAVYRAYGEAASQEATRDVDRTGSPSSAQRADVADEEARVWRGVSLRARRTRRRRGHGLSAAQPPGTWSSTGRRREATRRRSADRLERWKALKRSRAAADPTTDPDS